MGIAIFGQAFLRSTGLAYSPPWWPIALAGWAVIGLLASRGVRTTTRSLLAVELVAVVLILALMVVIFVKLATGDAPRGLGYTSDFLHLPSGVGALDAGLRCECGLPLVRGVRGGGLVRRGVARPEAHDSALDRRRRSPSEASST